MPIEFNILQHYLLALQGKREKGKGKMVKWLKGCDGYMVNWSMVIREKKIGKRLLQNG